MLNKSYCQRCDQIVSGHLVTAPGPSIAGKVIDQLVCKKCQAEHNEHMQKHFWKGAGHSGNTCCSGCGDGLTSQDGRIAHRNVKSDGTWEMTLMCCDCHDEYQGVCREAMTKKGE